MTDHYPCGLPCDGVPVPARVEHYFACRDRRCAAVADLVNDFSRILVAWGARWVW